MKKTKELLITLVGVVLIGVGFYLIKTVDNFTLSLHRIRMRFIWKWNRRLRQ